MKRLHAGSEGGGKMTSSKRRRRFSTSEDEDLGSQFTPKRNQSPPMSKIYNSGYRSNKPAELFRKDLISAMKLPDNEQLDSDSFWYLSDTWKQEWERGVQVPVNSQNVPVPCVRSASASEKTSRAGTFKLPKKLIRNTHDQFFSNEHHVLTNVGAKAEKICRYDMDDLDCNWLSVFNEHREDYGLSTIDETTLELVIEALENQCCDKFQEALRTEEGLGIEYDEDVVCDVCRSPDSEEGNEMVFCDSCNICVHQACYGITTIPEGSWICRTCALNIKPQCILCPVMGGAMKSTRSGQKWAHVSCALWIPEVSIGCAEKMEPIVKISQIPASRWALICTLCRERIGACIQCSVKQCKIAYHVTCAFENHLEMKAIFDDSGEEDGVKLRSYCPKHSRRTDESSSMNCQYIGSSNNNKSRKHKKEIKNSNVTDEDKHNARLQKIRMMEAEFHNYVNTKDTVSVTEVDANVVEFIFQYWKLKRKANFNKPLMTAKANESSLLCQQQENSLYAKTKLFVQLRQDLERVRNLCYMVSRREKLFRTWLRTRESVFWKQLEVLTEDSLNLSGDDIKQVLEANHSDSIYDVMYSYQECTDSEDKADDVKDKLASPRLPNPYAKCYLKGINSRSRRYASREASLDGSCSSSENIRNSVDSPICPQSSAENETFGTKVPTSQAPVVIKLASESQSCNTNCESNSTAYEQKDSELHDHTKKGRLISDVCSMDSNSDLNQTGRRVSSENKCDTKADLNDSKLNKSTENNNFTTYSHSGPVGSSSNKDGTVKRGRGRPRKYAVKEDTESSTVNSKNGSNERFSPPGDSGENDHKQESKCVEGMSSENCIPSENSASDEKEIPIKRRRGRPRTVNLDRTSGEESNLDILTNVSNADKTIDDDDHDVNIYSPETQLKCELDKFNEDSSNNSLTSVVDTSLGEKENAVRRRSGRFRPSLENKNCVQGDLELDSLKEVVKTCGLSEVCTDSCSAFKGESSLPFSEHIEPQSNIHNTRYQMRVRSQSLNSHMDERSSAIDDEVKMSWYQEETVASDLGSPHSDSSGGLKMSNKNRKETRRSSFCDLRKVAIDESLGNDNSTSSLDSPSSNDKENIVKHPKGKIKRAKHPENKEFIITAVDSVVEKEIEKDVSEFCDDKYIVDARDKQFEPHESGIHNNTRYQMRVRNQGNNVNPEDSSLEISLQPSKQQCEKTDNCNSVISNSTVTGKSSTTDTIRSRSSTPLRQSSVDAVEDGKVGPLEIKDSIRIQRRPSRRIWVDREADVARVFMKVSEKPEQVRKQDTERNFLNNEDVEMPSDMDNHSLKKSLRHSNKGHAAGDELEKQKLKVSERSLSVTLELLDAALQLPISESNIATLFPETETRSKRQYVENPLKKSRTSDFFGNDEIPKSRVDNLSHPASPRLVIRLRKDPDCQNWQKGPMPTNGTTAFKVVQNDWDAEDVSKLQPVADDTTFSDSLPSQIFPEDHQRNGHRYSMRRRTSKYSFDVS